MANPIPVGSDVSSGTYECTNCGYELDTSSIKSLPPCPNCQGPYSWESLSGGDSEQDRQTAVSGSRCGRAELDGRSRTSLGLTFHRLALGVPTPVVRVLRLDPSALVRPVAAR